MADMDWSKAGTRLRHTPRTPADGNRNPDWNLAARRWKTAEEYAGEELTADDVTATTECPDCNATHGECCADARGRAMDAPHSGRRFAAGAARIAAGWTL